MASITQADALHHFRRASQRFVSANAVDQQRDRHVFLRGQCRQQIELLKHEAHRLPAITRLLPRSHRFEIVIEHAAYAIVLIENPEAPATLNHLGVEVLSPGEVAAARARLSGEGLETTSEELVRTIHAHPTLSEAIHEAAEAVSGHAIHI